MKEWLGGITVALTFLGYVPYFYFIFKRQTKPHMFTWTTWTLINLIVFAGQMTSGSGAGSWNFLASSFLCLVVAILGYVFGDRHITKSDWISFCSALTAIPLWYLTNDPLGALLLITFIDVIGSYPTFRKSYTDPYGENLFAWIIFGLKSILSVFAIEHYSLTTLICPLAAVLINGGITSILIWQRHINKSCALPKSIEPPA